MKKSIKTVGTMVLAFVLAATSLPTQNVKAADIGTYTLSELGANRKYDVTGDGVVDAVQFKKLDADSNGYNGFQVMINGNTALHVKNVYYHSLNPVFVQTKGHAYFFICASAESDYNTFSKIYEYVDGKLKQRMNVKHVVEKIFNHNSPRICSVKDRTFKLKVLGQSDMLAATKATFNLKVTSTGKLSIVNKTVKVQYSKDPHYRYENGYGTRYLVAQKKMQAYQKSTGTKKAFIIKKGTKLKISKVSIRGKKARFYCVTSSGKKGWLVSQFNVFEGLIYAG